MTREETQLKKIGRLIATERRKQGYTSVQFAKRLGVSNPTMSHIEMGSASAIKNYLKAFRVLNIESPLIDGLEG